MEKHVLNREFCDEEKKKDILLSPMTKAPYTHRKIHKTKWQHKNATKNFDNTAIADRLRTVSWDNDSHPTEFLCI